MSFAFVPRAVAKPGKTRQSQSHPTPGPSTVAPARPPPTTPARDAPDETDDEPALLLNLALSDHALWTTPSLRDPNRDGYVSLSALLRTAPPFSGTSHSPVSVLKSVRAHARDAYDIRMIVVGDVGRARARADRKDVGGYEVRRRGWEEVVKTFEGFDRAYWQRRTLYMENIPHASRSMPGLVRLTSALLSHPPPTAPTVQSVVFPHHHQDDPSAVPVPKCKGFALLTLADASDVDRLLVEWPWTRAAGAAEGEAPAITGGGEDVRDEARKFGLRTLGKREWDKLQEEYLAYRERLLRAIAADARRKPPAPPAPPSTSQDHAPPPPATPTAAPQTPTLDINAPYPPGCVVYVRNVLPSTNKTTLKALFAASSPGIGIDYVDFTKGLDTCYIRLSSPSHARTLVAHFKAHPAVQADALDAKGSGEEGGGKRAMEVEVLGGRKEEVYWGQVPEKVRRMAVVKAVEAGGDGGDGGEEEGGGRRKKRKRM